MKKFFKNLMPMLLLVAGLGISPNAWAKGLNKEAHVYLTVGSTTKYYKINTEEWSTGAELPGTWGGNLWEQSFGAITTLKIAGGAVGGWTDNGESLNGSLYYKVYKEGSSEPDWTSFGSVTSNSVYATSSKNCFYYKNNGSTNILPSNPGKYCLKVKIEAEYNTLGGGNPAKFTVNPIVTFKANGGTGSDYTQTVTYNTSTKLNSNTFTAPTGCTFNGWNTSSDGSGTSYSDGDNITTTANVTLYAQWAVVLTVSKGTGISSVSESVNPASLNGKYDISATTATGYNFNKWTADPDDNAQFVDASSASTKVTIKNGSVTVTATATEILHDVTMASSDDNKGTVAITSTQKQAGIATAINIKATPKAGYYFTGWTASDGSKVTFGNAKSETTTAKVTADGITITANFANRYAFRGSLNETNNPHGGMPGWGNDALITFTEGTGTVQYSLQANKQYKFLIYDLKNSKNRGFTSADQPFTWDGTATFDGTFHALLNTRGTGTYTFTIAMNGDDPRVTLVGQVSHQITFGKGTGGSTITASSDNDGTITTGQYVKTGSTVTFTQTPSIGYEFKGWYTSADGSTAVDGITTAGVMANVTADKQVYAQYKPITYNITYPASPEHYTINAEAPKTADYNTSASFTVTPDKGYLVDVTAVKTGTSTEVTLQRSGNTYTISSMPAYNVTINVTAHKFKLNGWGESSSDKEFDANWEYKENLNALTTYEFKLHNTAPGLKNNGYFGNNGTIESTITSGWTMSDNEGTKLKLKTGIAGTYTFTYCEVEENGVMKPQIKVTFPQVSKLVYNDTDYPFTEVSSGVYKAGPLSLAASTTFNNNIRMYWEGTCIKNDNDQTMSASSHTNWGMERYTESTYYIKLTTAGEEHTYAKNPDNYYFYYKPNASPKPALTVEYPSYWRGDDIGWDYNHPMEFVNDVATIEMDVQTAGERKMKVIVEGQYWTYTGEAIETSTNDIQFEKDAQEKLAAFKFNVAESMKGIYTFTFNRATHKMSVNYPDVVQYDITYTDAEGTKTIKAGPNGGRGISAANKPGYKFVRWELYPDDINKIAVADNDKTRQTTTVYGKAEGCSITAIYTNEHFIYFKNIPNWSDVYVQFYSNPYFHGSDASTDKNKGTGTGGDNNTSLVNGTIYHMTHIDKTDIWYFDYSNFASAATDKHTVAFTDSKQDNHSFFDQCQVVYRGDFGECAPMMVPINYIDQYLNVHKDGDKEVRTCYYGQGHWMKYDAAKDAEMGIKLHIYEHKDNKWVDISGSPFNFLADNVGSYSSHIGGITLPKSDYVYHVKLEGCATGGTWYGNTGKMTSAECTNWVMSINTNDMEFEAKSAGPYTFRLSTGDGQLKLSAEYPLVEGDFRVVKTNNSQTYYTGLTYKCANTQADTASFYYNSTTESGYTFKVQTCTNAGSDEWADVSGATFTNPTQTGIYKFIFSHDGANVAIEKTEAYTGNYYVRCEALDGGLENYEANADNRMNYTTANPTFAVNNQEGYNYYKTRWITNGKDVEFTVANDYSKNISATMTGDNIIGESVHNLPADANVRFTWNSNTNALSRAYIRGSSNKEDKFVVVYGTYVFSDQECTQSLTDQAPGHFKDNQDWVYEYTLYATTDATATVMTSYNDHQQYLISNQAIFSSTKADDKAKLRTLYDFKTNRFVAAWTPSEKITSTYEISADIMLMRNGQQQADQMTFGDGGSITGAAKTVYGAVQFDKSLMALEGSGYEKYDRSIFWISFPFDVRLNDVFGLGQYGKYWIIRYYDGAERAQKGWFQETKTFWKTVSVEEREHGGEDGKGFVMKANEGYNLVLDYTAVLKDLYPNGATENYLFFPSKDKLTGIPASLQTESITYPALTCTITSPEDRTNEDSNWRVIGVPSYANAGELTSTEGIKFYYAWNRDNNTLGVEKIKETNPRGGEVSGTFQSMHAYMVQFAGTIDWKNMSITTTPATAPLFANNEKEEYSLRLELQQEGKKVDQAYVDLTDEATEEFDLNLDITKLMYSTSQIYSFIGNDKVAANSLPIRDVVVPLCVTAAADGTYTIALPDGTEGLNVTLYDVTAGKETNMSFDGYTVNLNKGEYNNRFLLNISVPRVPTNIRNANGEWSVDGKTKKLFINDNIYLINAGRIYNVLGE